MGPDLFALTWYDITNYVGLDITAKSFSRGTYLLCNLPPTARRKPPTRKQNVLPNYRASSVPTTEPARQLTGTTTVSKTVILEQPTGTTTENNVFIPLHHVNSLNRIVGVKGKSGIRNPGSIIRKN
jgi:hypothetical protein